MHPRQTSFAAARRAVIAAARAGTATTSLPAPLAAANQDAALAELARRRVTVDRCRRRERKPKPPQLPTPPNPAPPPPPRAPRSLILLGVMVTC
jgi:hypothetical protein